MRVDSGRNQTTGLCRDSLKEGKNHKTVVVGGHLNPRAVSGIFGLRRNTLRRDGERHSGGRGNKRRVRTKEHRRASSSQMGY